MAHVAKVKRAGVAPMVGHYERRAEGFGFERENIDLSRTHLNRAVGFESQDCGALARAVRDRVSEAVRSHEKTAGKGLRKDANVLYDWVVTLPKDCPEAMEEIFFQTVVRFIQNRYGAERVPGGFLHLDETTPHLHVPVIPTLDGKLMGSKVINRADLQTFHSELSRAVEEALGVRVSIELSEQEQAKKELSRLDQPAYKAAVAEQERAEREAREAVERLECLRQAEEAVEREIAELEPTAESITESARYIKEHQGDGARARKLEEELGRTRESVKRGAGFGGAIEQLRADIGMATAEIKRLAKELMERAGRAFYEVPSAVVEVLKVVVPEMHVYDRPMSLNEAERIARRVARDYGRGATRSPNTFDELAAIEGRPNYRSGYSIDDPER